VLLVLEQQVSLASAKAAFDRLAARLGAVTPEGVLSLGDEELRADGFSRQKTRYARALAAAVTEGALDLDGLAALDDESARQTLVALPGIGPWTANYVAMRALAWPDAFLGGDLVVRRALDVTTAAAAERIAEPWRPWRSYAVLHLWSSS
jgi:3-methyladenine DNA glycosylase/8-oxoguanine DNA glycosylase